MKYMGCKILLNHSLIISFRSSRRGKLYVVQLFLAATSYFETRLYILAVLPAHWRFRWRRFIFSATLTFISFFFVGEGYAPFIFIHKLIVTHRGQFDPPAYIHWRWQREPFFEIPTPAKT